MTSKSSSSTFCGAPRSCGSGKGRLLDALSDAVTTNIIYGDSKNNEGVPAIAGEFDSDVTERQGVLFSGQRRQSCYHPLRDDKN